MIAQSVAEIVGRHVKLSIEGIDRMYLNVYVPGLQYEQGIVRFFREHRRQPLPSAALMSPMTRRFVAALEDFVVRQRIPLVQFCPGQRKDAVMAAHLRRFDQEEGVVFVGKAQEKTPVFGTERRRSPRTGRPYPWIVRRSAMVNNYYIYAVDRDFDPFFLKFCSYFPYNAKLCLNGHEYAKRQLAKQGIAFAALDNGILKCADPKRLQAICDGLSAAKIDALLRKWLRLSGFAAPPYRPSPPTNHRRRPPRSGRPLPHKAPYRRLTQVACKVDRAGSSRSTGWSPSKRATLNVVVEIGRAGGFVEFAQLSASG